MTSQDPLALFLDAALVNNFVLAYFLGICPFLGVSGRVETALRMGAAVSFVMLVASVSAWGLQTLLEAADLLQLRLVAFVLVIATLVQLVELFVRRTSPALFEALGIFLPLITTNCAILGLALFQTNRGLALGPSVAYALGAGAGFTLALLLMAGVREKLRFAPVPASARGMAGSLVVAGILSLTFMGFAGMGSGT
ncbi:MAG: Rnf-Nqr domain containing protein [Pseudomonadales bacterium]|jgi:electron transport complex protein RnfA|nr:Rnf-Nqr domain containing protein [Pseudomonadales bacterium]